jgi:hypothetical protein
MESIAGDGWRLGLFDIVDRNCGRFCGRVFPGREAGGGCGLSDARKACAATVSLSVLRCPNCSWTGR